MLQLFIIVLVNTKLFLKKYSEYPTNNYSTTVMKELTESPNNAGRYLSEFCVYDDEINKYVLGKTADKLFIMKNLSL